MSEVFDLSKSVAHLHRDGHFHVATSKPGPPERIDGYTVGAPRLRGRSPHRGEMHPDGDELLFVVSGRMDLVLEEGGDQETVGKERTVELSAGDAIVVPKGVWHRVVMREPGQLVHVTPGPGGGARLLG